MKRNRKKIIGLASGILVIIAVVGIYMYIDKDVPVSIAKEVNNSFELFDGELATTPMLAAQSNPYAYRELDSYKKLVALGTEAVPVIVDKINSDEVSGLKKYIAVIALEEITDTDVKAATDGYLEDQDDYWDGWKKMILNLETDMQEIQNSDSTEDEKIEKMSYRGIFAKQYLVDASEKKEIDQSTAIAYLKGLSDKPYEVSTVNKVMDSLAN